jgi:hypothetical protein
MQLISAVALFCEDIREEKAGPDTLIGIYPDNVIVPAIPYAFPKFAIYLRVNMDPTCDPQSFTLRIRMPDGNEPIVSEFDEEFVAKTKSGVQASGAPLLGFISRITTGNFPVSAPGRILAIVKMGDQEFLAGALNVQAAPPPS